ncbi:MAG: oxidative damage protection protein [Sulfuricaulis sp.]
MCATAVLWSSPMARMVKCIKLGRETEALDFPPYPGALGKRIFENVSKEAWKQWLEHQKTLVNENRSGADVASGYTPPQQK